MKALHVWAIIGTFGVVYRFYEPNMNGDKYKYAFEELPQGAVRGPDIVGHPCVN